MSVGLPRPPRCCSRVRRPRPAKAAARRGSTTRCAGSTRRRRMRRRPSGSRASPCSSPTAPGVHLLISSDQTLTRRRPTSAAPPPGRVRVSHAVFICTASAMAASARSPRQALRSAHSQSHRSTLPSPRLVRQARCPRHSSRRASPGACTLDSSAIFGIRMCAQPRGPLNQRHDRATPGGGAEGCGEVGGHLLI